jgi:predicted nucleic acid-binding protein
VSEFAGTVVDTDVFSSLYIRKPTGDVRIPGWREALADRRVLIAFQTRAEVLAGVRSAGWGKQRVAQVLGVLDRTPTIHSDAEVVEAYAILTAECRRSGHALHDRPHTGDRWIAACAIAKQFDLLAGDTIYQGAPNLAIRN